MSEATVAPDALVERGRIWTDDMTIRTTTRDDLPALQRVLCTIELFPAEMLPDISASHLDGDGDDVWLTALSDDQPVGLLYAAPEEQAEGDGT